MTEDELNEIEARANAAKPGPWSWAVRTKSKSIYLLARMNIVMDFVRYGINSAQPRFNAAGIMKKSSDLVETDHNYYSNKINHPDAEFIAHARGNLRKSAHIFRVR